MRFEESESDSSSSTLFPEPLDGGYGWVIVLASFCIHFICDGLFLSFFLPFPSLGISFSFGIMFPEIQQYFNATKTMSGVVGSIFLSIPLLSGPLAAVLTDIYDCRGICSYWTTERNSYFALEALKCGFY
uniref:Uncharacterized protein n=1 Tax=Parascaris equorum TaxID=6256 RepID=A0A914RQZ5_PAREQ